jgi:hypothetical protein
MTCLQLSFVGCVVLSVTHQGRVSGSNSNTGLSVALFWGLAATLADHLALPPVILLRRFFIFPDLKMKQIVVNQTVKVPEGVSVTAKSRRVIVRGPRGVLRRSFRHLAIDISIVEKNTVKVEKWFGSKKEIAAVRTVCSHIENLIKGVTKVSSSSILMPLNYKITPHRNTSVTLSLSACNTHLVTVYNSNV